MAGIMPLPNDDLSDDADALAFDGGEGDNGVEDARSGYRMLDTSVG